MTRLLSVLFVWLLLPLAAVGAPQASTRSEVIIHGVTIAEGEGESTGARSYQIKAGESGRGIVLVIEKKEIQFIIVPAGFALTAAVDRGTAEESKTTILLYQPGASVDDARLIDSLIVRPNGVLEFTSDGEHAALLRRQHETEEAVHAGFREAFREILEEEKE